VPLHHHPIPVDVRLAGGAVLVHRHIFVTFGAFVSFPHLDDRAFAFLFPGHIRPPFEPFRDSLPTRFYEYPVPVDVLFAGGAILVDRHLLLTFLAFVFLPDLDNFAFLFLFFLRHGLTSSKICSDILPLCHIVADQRPKNEWYEPKM
jgi:hypothetical protein